MSYADYYSQELAKIKVDITANKAAGERLRRALAELRKKRREALEREQRPNRLV